MKEVKNNNSNYIYYVISGKSVKVIFFFYEMSCKSIKKI